MILSPEILVELAAIVEAGPDREKDGVVRWRGSIFSGSLRNVSALTIASDTSAPF